MKMLISAAACCVLLMGCAREEKAVAKAFEDYRSAILNKQGSVAVNLVTQRTIDDYQQQLDWALSADRQTVESLSLANRLQVLMLRHRIPAETLKGLDGASVFAYAVDQNWIGQNAIVRMSIGKVHVASNRATAEVRSDGKATSTRFQFAREKGKWRIDLIPLLQGADQALQIAARQKGMTENAFMYSMMESISGRKVPKTIWIPIQGATN